MIFPTEPILAVSVILSLPVLFALWTYRKDPSKLGLRIAVHAGTLLAATVTHLLLAKTWQVSAVLWSALILFVGGWLIEFVGERTGFPFGRYRYGTYLYPRLFGVPLAVPVGYMVVLPTVWGVADQLTRGSRGFDFICFAALAATLWDLILDPLFVHWKAWSWEKAGGYFGIPWSNFFGWFIVTATMSLIVNPGPLNTNPLIRVFTSSCIIGIATLLLHLPSQRPGIVATLTVGVLLVLMAR
ncbi:MAG: carotenoid biosynthesis protein [Zavarzinella sp.]